MSKVISFGLSVESIETAIAEIRQYQQELEQKCERFVRELIDEGITVGRSASAGADYGGYLVFTSEVSGAKSMVTGVMCVTESGIIHSEWLQADGSYKTADVSPLLMVEFGSGQHAQNPKNIEGVGRGTFPGQTHAFQPGWWYATGPMSNPEWHYSTGYKPSQPVYKASVAMFEAINKVAQRVFA